MSKNIKDKLKGLLSEAKEAEATTVVEETKNTDVEMTGIAVDLVKEGKDFKRVYVAYDLESGEAKVVKVVQDKNKSMPMSMQRTVKFITDKILLNKKEML